MMLFLFVQDGDGVEVGLERSEWEEASRKEEASAYDRASRVASSVYLTQGRRSR